MGLSIPLRQNVEGKAVVAAAKASVLYLTEEMVR